jgi:hypothetical protein
VYKIGLQNFLAFRKKYVPYVTNIELDHFEFANDIFANRPDPVSDPDRQSLNADPD